MTYDARERSEQDAAPVELYLFARNAQMWRFTSCEADQTFESESWASAPITRTEIEITPEQARNDLELTVPRSFALADLYRITSPTDVITLIVYRYHRGDSDPAVIWMGRLLNVKWSGAQAKISCEPVSLSLGRTGLRRLYQKSCPHVLYGTACTVIKADHARVSVVTAIDGLTITVDALDAKPYAGGFVEFEVAGGNLERRFIRSFSGLVLTLSQPFQGLEVGDSVTEYPGCNHTMDTCNAVYDNLVNYGGMPFIPSKNPFDGTPVY